MPYFVYILYSEKLQRFYTGTTDDVDRRMEEHNSGKYPDSSSVKGMPWNLFLKVECETSQRAYRFEALIKRMKSSQS
jgi:putative endonuclease